jgi:hypothetical protein
MLQPLRGFTSKLVPPNDLLQQAERPSMTCHVTSIAHWLPPKGEIEVDPTASEQELREEKKRVAREHQREVEADDPGRDILWPLEQVRSVPSMQRSQLTTRQSTAECHPPSSIPPS